MLGDAGVIAPDLLGQLGLQRRDNRLQPQQAVEMQLMALGWKWLMNEVICLVIAQKLPSQPR